MFFFHFPPMSGGGSIVSHGIVNALSEFDNKITVLVPDVNWNESKYTPKLNNKATVLRVQTPSRSNLKIAARRCKNNLIKKGINIGRKEKYDFVLTIFHPFHRVPHAAVECAKKLNIPVIIKVDDAIFDKTTGLKSIQRKIEKISNTKVIKNADLILVSNNKTRSVIIENYNIESEKISIVPNGIDIESFVKHELKQNFVIFSGMMYHHRGLEVLLKAAQKVITKNPKIKFMLLGDGPEKNKLIQLTEDLGISSNVEFKGWVNREQIPHLLAKSLIGIGPLKLTAVTEGALPIKVLEYMASSLPIIAKKGTLSKDILYENENGFLIDDYEDLAEKINILLENQELREKMGLESLNLVKKFDWEKIGQKIIYEYEKIEN
jgi:glycosyltransferase involved in cell wall biosynthesis